MTALLKTKYFGVFVSVLADRPFLSLKKSLEVTDFSAITSFIPLTIQRVNAVDEFLNIFLSKMVKNGKMGTINIIQRITVMLLLG